MAGRGFDQRYKSLLVLQILLRYTDKDHPLTAKGIAEKLLKLYGMLAEEHSICRDIKELQRLYSADEEDAIDEGKRFPYKIEYDGSGKRGYKVTKRPCEFSDLQLLAECIHSSSFISNAQEKRLLTALKEFCSKAQAKILDEKTSLVDRVKTGNDRLLVYIRTINKAIKNQNKIKFKYMKHILQNRSEQVPRSKGFIYTVSPFCLLVDEGNFYLLGYNGKRMTTYRVDRMENVMEIKELREGAELFKQGDMHDFTKRVFSMYRGTKENVTIRFTNDLLDTVVDRFGAHGAMYIPEGKNHFNIHVDVEVSNMFYSWVCGFRKKATIINPPEVVDGFKAFLADINQRYESC